MTIVDVTYTFLFALLAGSQMELGDKIQLIMFYIFDMDCKTRFSQPALIYEHRFSTSK
ncbi:MAG: hypothetical protein ACW964_03595 [Candidatus Hodarchaeales archaeon]|jgi:hypothetical protein